jgi:hypothetical protein
VGEMAVNISEIFKKLIVSILKQGETSQDFNFKMLKIMKLIKLYMRMSISYIKQI